MFSLDSLLQDAFPHRNTPAWQRSLLRTLLFEKEFKQFAADYPHLKGLDLIEQVVDYFNLSCELVDGDLENIPSQGPVVLVANHPIGSLDGLVLLRAVAAVRPDVKVVASQLLTYIEPLRNLFVPVDNVAYGLLDPAAAGVGLHPAPPPVPHHHAALAPILLYRRIPERHAL